MLQKETRSEIIMNVKGGSMINFVKPYGFISRSLIKKVIKNAAGFWLLDTDGNRMQIEEATFVLLKKEGYAVENN